MAWLPRRRDVLAAAERRRLRFDRRSFIAFAVVALVVVVSLWWRAGVADRGRGPSLDEVGVVTVVALVDGHVTRVRRRYDHRVQLPNGTETVMRFGEILPKGARVWVSYRRWLVSNETYVKTYVPQ